MKKQTCVESSHLNPDTFSKVLERMNRDEGHIPSEFELRRLLIQNSDLERVQGFPPPFLDNPLCTATLSVARGEERKVILPYRFGETKLTRPASFCMDLFLNSGNTHGAQHYLPITQGDWDNIEGPGVYSLKCEDVPYHTSQLTKEEALSHKLIQIKLGNPDYVEKEFANPKQEIEYVLDKTFEIGKKKGVEKMMRQPKWYPNHYTDNSPHLIMYGVGNILNGMQSHNLRFGDLFFVLHKSNS